ncbi:hypothetical protein N7540_010969 [Penicillium herquei]|nr:hypothetical protein N7540_010969 [Penicillium herquei]
MEPTKDEGNSGGELLADFKRDAGKLVVSESAKSALLLVYCLTLPVYPTDHQSRRAAHGFFGTEIDASSCVFNGDFGDVEKKDGSRVHMISGGSVKNKSVLINGDLDPESFKQIFGKGR